MIKIGEYELYSIETSEFGLDGGAMFGIILSHYGLKS